MDLTKLTVILLLLAVSTCRGKVETSIKDTSKYDKSMDRLTDILINLVTSCHKGRTSGVGLAGNLPSTLYKRLSAQHMIPVALVGNVYKYGYRKPILPGNFKQSLNTFIIAPKDFHDLDLLLMKNLRILRWWNNMASLYILDLSSGCVKPFDFLWAAWCNNLLHSTVLCRSHTGGRIAFIYNPFTGKGPVSWRKELTHYDNNTFNVFSRKFRDNETIVCDDFVFDKTADLGGADIRIKGQHDDYSKSTATTLRRGTYAFETRRRSMLRTLFSHLNATLTFVDAVKALYHRIEAEPQGLQYNLGNYFVLTYPHRQVEASIITQFRGPKSQLRKVLSIIDAASWYGTGVVYLITLIFLKIVGRQTVAPALLNLVRITCNVAFENLPNDTSSRIYIGCLLFFVVTMQGIFQGNLAARLTQYMPLKNVESIRDLEELGYKKICGREYYRRAFEASAVHKNFIASDDERDCIMRVVNDSSSAYVGRVESFIIDLVEEHNLHISRKPVEMIYVGFPIYPFWTLTDRVNAMISRQVEADALELWEMKCRPIELSDFYEDPAVKTNVDFKKIELHELFFAFVILGIGLSCATVVFVIEQVIGYEYVCDITIWRHGDTWEERVIEVLPDNRRTQ